MKLFEMFSSDEQQGRVNIKKIVESARKNTGATILAGSDLVVLEAEEVKEVYGLYETALTYGTEDAFVSSLGRQLNENQETLDHILDRFPKEVKDFQMGGEIDDDLYHALYDYYNLHGEMPYGVAKARTGDPFEWVTQRLDQELGGGGFSVTDADRPEESLAGVGGIFDSLHEGVKKKVGEGWDDMLKSVKNRDHVKVGDKWKTSRGEVEKTATGTIHRRSYDPKTGESDEPKTDGEGNAPEKRGRGRPRTRPVPDANAPKRGRGRPRKNPLPDANAPKRGRGRPKKVREFIDNLRSVAKGR